MQTKPLLMVLMVLPGWLMAQTVVADTLPLAPFQARYSGFVDVAGIDLGTRMPGTMELSLKDIGNGRYQMDSRVTAMLGTVHAQASGEFQKDSIRPARYEQTLQSLKNAHTQLTFDWSAKTVRAVEDDENKTLPLQDRVVDPLSLHLLVMWDLQQGERPRQYTLVSGTRLKTYQVKLEGEETLKTPVGNLRVLRLTSTRENAKSERSTTLWLAPKLGYLPVQVVHQDEGKETLRMLLEEVSQDPEKGRLSFR